MLSSGSAVRISPGTPLFKKMKLALKILFIVIVAAGILYLGLCVFILLSGKELIRKNLAELTQKEASVESLDIGFPLEILIKKVEVRDLLKVDSIYVSPSILGFFTGSVILNKVKFNSPELKLQRLPQEPIASTVKTKVASVAAASVEKTKEPASPAKKAALHFACKHIIAQDGKIDFLDLTTGEGGIRILVKDIDFDLTNLYFFPRQAVSNFSLKARIPWIEGQSKEDGTLQASGWLDLFKRNMQATLKIQNIDGISLYPYYSNWVDLKKARIERAKLNFTSDIRGLNNDITADCHLELSDIIRRPLAEEEQDSKAARITDAVLEIFKALNQGKIVLDFTIHTKMDKPQFGFRDIQGAFETKLTAARKGSGISAQDVLNLPKRLIEGTVKSAVDISKAVIGGTVSVGKELKSAVEVAFKKEPSSKQAQPANSEEVKAEKQDKPDF